MKPSDDIKLFLKAIPNSYGQVFFSDQRLFSFILVLVTFFDLYAGLFGLLSVVTTNLAGFLLGFDKRTIARGLFGFNSLLVGLGLGVYFQPGLLLVLEFSADVIGAFVKKCGIGDRVKHKKLIIPGYIAIESGGLEEELPGWEIQIGPREGAHIPAYLKGWQ
ncbi:MAG: urea transporter [Bacteroidales bacterium]